MARRRPKPREVAQWAGRDDGGEPVGFRLVDHQDGTMRPMRLELRRAPEGVWTTMSRVVDQTEAQYVLDEFYETIFDDIQRL